MRKGGAAGAYHAGRSHDLRVGTRDPLCEYQPLERS